MSDYARVNSFNNAVSAPGLAGLMLIMCQWIDKGPSVVDSQLGPRAAGAEPPGRGDPVRDARLVLAGGQTDGRSVWVRRHSHACS